MTRIGISAGAVLLALLASTAEADQMFTFTEVTPASSGPVLSSVDVDLGSTSLSFTMNFAGPIEPLSASATNSVAGFVNIDTTRTASPSELLTLPSDSPANIDYYVDLTSQLRNGNGTVNLVQTSSDEPTAQLPISFAADSLSFSVPLADLGGSNGQVDFGVIVGGPPPDYTNELVGSTLAVPEPASVAAVSSLILSAGAILIARRKRAR